jgi:protein transport protein SEC9
MENEIDGNLDLLHGAAKRLNHLAGAMGREVDIQNTHLDKIGGKVDKVDDEIALNRSRLDRIK